MNNLNATRKITIKIEQNYLIIEKTLNNTNYTIENIKEDIKDIEIFYEQIYKKLKPANNINYQNNIIYNNTIEDQKKLDLYSPRFQAGFITIILIVCAILNFIICNFNSTLSIFLLIFSLVMFIIYYILRKMDITYAKPFFLIVLLILLPIAMSILNSDFYKMLKFKSYTKNIENIFENKKFNFEENIIYSIKYKEIYLNNKKIYSFYNDISIDQGYLIVKDNKIEYMLEYDNKCIYKNFDDTIYKYTKTNCNFKKTH